MATTYIGLGSNLHDPVTQIHNGIQSLAVLKHSRLIAKSHLYQSPPMGPQDQADFINAVVKLETALTPIDLLNALLAIEDQSGRIRTRHWGPRTLDLDIILYDTLALDSPRLKIPHPGLYDRNFVLYPLHEIEPNLEIPGYGSIAGLLATCPQVGLEVIPKD